MLTYCYLLSQRETGCHEWLSAPSEPRTPASDSSRVHRSLGWTTQQTLPARQERHASHGREFFLQPRAPRHIYCDWAPLGYLYRRQEGGGWREKNSVSTDLLVYRRAAQAEFRQKKQLTSQGRSRPPSINYRCGSIFLKICFVFYYERR